MSKKLQFKRSENISTYTPVLAEPIYDISRKQFRIGDGSTAGGVVPKELFYTSVISGAEYTAESDSCVLVDCSSNSVKINLPDTTTLPTGSIVKILDVNYAAGAEHSINVFSTAKINNVQSNFIIDLPRAYITFIYVVTTQNWIVDLGGIIIPSYEIVTTNELEWTEEDQLGIKQVSFEKVVGPMDLGEF